MKHVREVLDTSTIVRYPTIRYDISNISHTNPPLHADAIAELLVSIPPRGEDRGVLFFQEVFRLGGCAKRETQGFVVW